METRKGISMKCNKPNCICDHLDPCEAGWVRVTQTEIIIRNLRDGTKKEEQVVYDAYTFCPTCDPERAHIVATSQTIEERNQKLASRSQFKVIENYDKLEASKTRTL
jgi:hypothetical protein